MKLVPVNEQDYFFKKTKNQAILEEFLNSDYDCVLIQDHGHKSAKNAQSCLMNTARRFGYTSIKISVRGEKLFMYKL